MKKLMLLFLTGAVVFFALVYFFTPKQMRFRNFMYVRVSSNNANQFLLNEKEWYRWWPGNAGNKADSLFEFNGSTYAVNWKMTLGDSIIITSEGKKFKSLLNVIPVNIDSIAFQWEGAAAEEANPIKRFSNYFLQKKMENNADKIFKELKKFLENRENVYGIKIEQGKVTDTLLISQKKEFAQYPSTAEIYLMIDGLRNYMAANGAAATNNPMLHVVQDSGRFKTMVAIPVNKTMPNSDSYIIKKMVAGKILIAEIKGGSAAAEEAIKKVEMYMQDYHIVAPAISFQSLITDRTKEPDSTKWITRIYYPRM